MWETHIIPALAIVGLAAIVFGLMSLALRLVLWLGDIISTKRNRK